MARVRGPTFKIGILQTPVHVASECRSPEVPNSLGPEVPNSLGPAKFPRFPAKPESFVSGYVKKCLSLRKVKLEHVPKMRHFLCLN